MYHVPGEPDAHACEVYGSCDPRSEKSLSVLNKLSECLFAHVLGSKRLCRQYVSLSLEDGSIFLQFIIRDHAGRTLAHTPYLSLFQSSFNIEVERL